jgi:hypothetical protein
MGFINSSGLHGVVNFNGVLANTVFSYSNTAIIVAVPVGATTGPVFLELVNEDSNSLTFTVTASGTPHITSLTPNNGGIGISVVIAGTNFGASQGASTVTLDGLAATVVSWSATSITITVPTMAMTGAVIVTVGGIASNSVTFTVTNPSNGGTAGPIGMLLIPVQQFTTQVVLTFDTTDFDDQSVGSFYLYKIEEIAQGRVPTCSRQMITYRDLGLATITATLSGVLFQETVGTQNTQFPKSISETFVIGTSFATGAICTVVRGLTLSAQNLQYTITRQPAAGPVSIIKTRLEGRVELTAYA